ncbi:MAG: 3-coathanger stack domain-containing protein [Saprospiraceae bacterium]
MIIKILNIITLLLLIVLPSTVFTQITVDHIMGANARERDPIPRMKAVGFIREYHNWFFNEGYPDGSNPPNYSLGYPNAKYKWNAPYQDTSPTTLFDDFYQTIKDNQLDFAPSFLGTIRQLVDPNNTLPYGEHIIDEFRPVAPNTDTLNPASYLAHAAYMYQYAARYGHQSFTSNKIDSFIRPFTHLDETPKTGLGMVNYMENWNEQDKFWYRDFNGAHQTYFTPQVYAAMLSADYDGHLQTMGLKADPDNPGNMVSTVGIKNADANMKVVIGGLAVADIDYFRGIVEWAKTNRTNVPLAKVLPFDALNIHKYTGDSLAYLNSRFGISPEAGRLRDTLLTFAAYRDSLEIAFNVDLELWISEFGYDTYTPQTGTPSGVVPSIGDNDNYEVQGQWLVRSYLEAVAAGVEKAIMFDLRDECTDPNNPNGTCGLFSSSGLLENIHNNFKPKTSWFYTYTMKNVLTGMVYDDDLSNCSDTTCTKIYRFKDPNGSNKRVYAIWQPTSSDDTTNYHFLNEDLMNATLVKMEIPSIRGISETITNPFPTLTVTERPQFIIVNDTYFISQNCTAGSLSTNNPTCSSINVLVDVPANSGTYQLWSMQGNFAASEFNHRTATFIKEALVSTDSVITIPNLFANTFYTFFLIPEGVGTSESDKICTTQNTTLATTSSCYLTIQSDWVFDDFQNNIPFKGIHPYTLFDEQHFGDSICRTASTLPASIWGFNDSDTLIRSVSLDLQAYYYIDLFTLHDQYSEGDFTIQMAHSPNGPWTTIETYYTTLNNEWTHLTNLTPPNTPIRYLKFIAAANNEAKVGELLICGRLSDYNPDLIPGVAKNGMVTNLTCNEATLAWADPFDMDIAQYLIYAAGNLVGTTMTNGLTINSLTANTPYAFKIVTEDAGGNRSVDSLTIEVTTNMEGTCDLLCNVTCPCAICIRPSWVISLNENTNFSKDALFDEQDKVPFCGETGSNPTTAYSNSFAAGSGNAPDTVLIDLQKVYDISALHIFFQSGSNENFIIQYLNNSNNWTELLNHTTVPDFSWKNFSNLNASTQFLRIIQTDNNSIIGEIGICGTEYVNLDCPATIDINGTIAQTDTFRAGSILSNGTLVTGTKVGFFAENMIQLIAGFHAVAGSFFTAKIAPCPTDLTTAPTASFAANTHLATPPIFSTKNTLNIYPNPFQYSTTLVLDLAQSAKVQLIIFDATGRSVKTLVNDQLMESGQHEVLFSNENLKSGFYFAHLQVDQEILLEKMVFLEH